jgi:hypothetical protein
MLTVITGVMTITLIALMAGRRRHARAELAKREYYSLYYARRVAPLRRRGSLFRRNARELIAPLLKP